MILWDLWSSRKKFLEFGDFRKWLGKICSVMAYVWAHALHSSAKQCSSKAPNRFQSSYAESLQSTAKYNITFPGNQGIKIEIIHYFSSFRSAMDFKLCLTD